MWVIPSVLPMTTTAAPTTIQSRGTPGSRLPFAAAAWSVLAAATGAWWLLVPDHYGAPTGSMGDSLVGLVDPTLVSGLLLALGVLGAVVAAVGTEGGRTAPHPWVTAPAIALAVVFGFLVPDMGLLVGLGYASALLGIPAMVVLSFVLAVRHRAVRPVAAGLVAIGVVAVVGYDVDGPALASMLREIGGNLPEFLRGQAFAVLSFAGGALWLGMALRASGVRIAGARPASWTTPARDRGWWITVAAVACPLLFAVQRMSWLTPWPVALDAHTLDANPGLRAFGLTLGVAAVLGAVLTAGLISRWGAVYPRWVPGVGGRLVSPVWPSILAVTVGAVVTVAGRSLGQFVLLTDSGRSGDGLLVGMAVTFVVWGPLLVASAIAYFARRVDIRTGSRPSRSADQGSR